MAGQAVPARLPSLRPTRIGVSGRIGEPVMCLGQTPPAIVSISGTLPLATILRQRQTVHFGSEILLSCPILERLLLPQWAPPSLLQGRSFLARLPRYRTRSA